MYNLIYRASFSKNNRRTLNQDNSASEISTMIEKMVAEQKIINKEQLELLEENKKIIATGAIAALIIGGGWNHFQNKKMQSQLEQQQRVTRTKTTEVIRDPNGGATFREIITDERPVGDNHDRDDNENSTMLLALREFTRPVDQG